MSDVSTAQARINQAAMRLFAEKGAAQISVSELAQAAGVARGTIYNNCADPELLFDQVASSLAAEMHERIARAASTIEDPAEAVANGLRHFIRRTHEEPDWGRFILRFAFSSGALRSLLEAQPSVDLMNGIRAGRFHIQPEQMMSTLAMLGGAGVSAMLLVLEGHKTWRDAGSGAAELVLRALGLDVEEARTIAYADLLPLPKQLTA